MSFNILQRDAWELREELKCPLCILTNGYTNSSGRNVMGRGIAREAKIRYPLIDLILAERIAENGHICQPIPIGEGLISFPTKPIMLVIEKELHRDLILPHFKFKYPIGSTVPGWACSSRIDIIERSAKKIMELINFYKFNKVILPFPGIGNGGLDSVKVREALTLILDDRVIIVSK